MNKVLLGFVLLSVCGFCFAQQTLVIKGGIPRPDSSELYRIQVGAFKMPANSERALVRLRNAGFYPAHEYYRDFTRVFLSGIPARDIRLVLKRIETLGFAEVWISPDRNPPYSEGVTVRPGDLAPARPNDFAGSRHPPQWERPAARPNDAAPVNTDGFAESRLPPLFEIPTAQPDDVIPVNTDDFAESRLPPLFEIPAAPPDDVIPINTDDFAEPWLPPLLESDIVDPLYYTLELGQSKTVDTDMIPDNRQALWTSRNPDIAAVDDRGKVTGIRSGSTVIEAEVDGSVIDISVAVVPDDTIYRVPRNQEIYVKTDGNTRFTPGTARLTEYKTEPTSRLAYRFVNPTDSRGASGTNGGIDVLSKGPDDTWMWTTYYQGGFFYDLNGFQHTMIDGVQRDPNGVVLTVEPSFVYIDGVPYLQLEHKLRNTSDRPVSRQKFGAGADVMIHSNDHAPIAITDYGLLMTDIHDDTIESMNLMLVGKTGPGITPVSTLWIGRWEQGNHLNHVYENGVDPAYFIGSDSAIAFSYQDITLNPGEIKSFILRLTLARNSN